MIEVRCTIYIVFLYNITNREVENDVGTSQVSDLPAVFLGKMKEWKDENTWMIRRDYTNDDAFGDEDIADEWK